MARHGLKLHSDDFDDDDSPDDDSPRAEDPTRRFLVVYAQRHEQAPMERLVYEHARMEDDTSQGWLTVWCHGEARARFREPLVRSWEHYPVLPEEEESSGGEGKPPEILVSRFP